MAPTLSYLSMNFTPLAERRRPKNLDQIYGQEHLIGSDGPLRKMIDTGTVPSMVFWGPPGVGKTTLAEIIAESSGRPFRKLSAIDSGVKEVREILKTSGGLMPTILFLDEIHRFNKSQQDALLGAVERGKITLIGATTENPSFEVNPALLSRCQVFVLNELTKNDLIKVAEEAIKEDEELAKFSFEIESFDSILRICGGDCRKLLNILEMAASQAQDGKVIIKEHTLEEWVANGLLRYDKSGEQHYDIISAFIKSMRGSDPNASIYWLSRMVSGGENPLFIARRMIVFASEDIGNANPTALVLANNCYQAVHAIGMPEGRIVLAQTAAYLASSVKSNASYKAIEAGLKAVQKTGNLDVPLYLRNSPTRLMKELGYGKGYQYPHDQMHSFSGQEYMPEELEGTKFYEPGENDRERQLRKFLSDRWKEKYGY